VETTSQCSVRIWHAEGLAQDMTARLFHSGAMLTLPWHPRMDENVTTIFCGKHLVDSPTLITCISHCYLMSFILPPPE